jgi:hypothetical protein
MDISEVACSICDEVQPKEALLVHCDRCQEFYCQDCCWNMLPDKYKSTHKAPYREPDECDFEFESDDETVIPWEDVWCDWCKWDVKWSDFPEEVLDAKVRMLNEAALRAVDRARFPFLYDSS